MAEVYLGIDFGTQSVKCVFCELEERCNDSPQQHQTARILLTGKSQQLDVIQTQEGYAEQDPSLWIRAMKEAIANALDNDKTQSIRDRVKSIGISGQQHGLVALDSENQIIRPCMLWCDTRAISEATTISNFSGRSIPPGFTAPKIMWLLAHEPNNYHRTDKFMLPHDFINFYLSGYQTFSMECGDASGTGLIDFSTREWDRRSIDFIHPHLHTKLPSALTAPDQRIGLVSREIARELGISFHGDLESIILAPGCGDNAMTILGISAVTNSTHVSSSHSSNSEKPASPPLLISLGTSGTLMLTSSLPMIDPKGSVALFGDATGRWLSLVCLQNCSMVPDEILNTFISTSSSGQSSEAPMIPSHETISSLRARLISLASAVSPGCDGLTLLPYFSSGGERTPNWPQSSGCFIGLRHGHLQQPELLYRASLEGVTFSLFRGYQELKQLADSLTPTAGVDQLSPLPPLREICVVGGGAQNQLWKQMIADVFNLPVCSPTPEIGNHAAAIGGAVQAMAIATGLPFESFGVLSGEAMQMNLPTLTEAERESYQRAYERHVHLSNLLFGTNDGK
jgi:xylulokinase